MIIEVGLFSVDDSAGEFEAVAADIRAAFAAGGIDGLHSFHMAAELEDPGRWVVIVGWDSVEAHERFVASEEGQRQRVVLRRFIVGGSEVLHFDFADVVDGLR